MVEQSTETKELWGVKFPVVSQGLDEDAVVSYVQGLQEESRKMQEAAERQSSLVRLAEQTVVEAEKLAEDIKKKATKEGEAQAATIRQEAVARAEEEARQIIQSGEKEAASQSRETLAKAEAQAQRKVGQAQQQAQSLLDEAKAKVASIESEAKLEAEFIVRRMTQKASEGIRHAVNETCNSLLPNVDDVVSELREKAGPQDDKEKKAPRSRRGSG